MPTNTTTYLTRSQGTATSDKIGTFSAWIKSPQEGETNSIFTGYTDNNNKIYSYIGGGGLSIYGATGGSQSLYFVSNRKLRDVNGWYHIVITWDTTQSTESNRIKIYVNNVQETSFSTASYPSQNADIYWNKGTTSLIGARYVSSIVNFYYGSMSHIHFTDGTAYTPSAFGETDTTTGEWKAKTSPSVTYGTNGFFILKDGNGITDQSGEGNDFTLGGGTLTDLKDNPDNVFATMNPLNHYTGQTFEAGNTVVKTISGNAVHQQFVSTLGISSGKFYWELKNHLATTSSSRIGISSENVISNPANLTGSDGHVGDDPQSYGYVASSGNKETNNSSSSYGNSFTNGDILMVALDMDNNKLYFGKNGTWQNSGDPTSGSTGTGSAFTVTSGLTYFPACSILGGGGESYQFNFGNGYFNTTAVSSAGTNASENGIFEYDVPTGYTALSTKGLNL
jgi:hypothetical protein